MRKLLLFTAMLFVFTVNAQLRLVKDINPGNVSSNPGSFYEYGGRLFFSAYSPLAADNIVFATDGTTVGTTEISFSTSPYAYNGYGTAGFYQYNSQLYFEAKFTSGVGWVAKLSGDSNASVAFYNIGTPNNSTNSRFRSPVVGVNNKLIFNPVVNANALGLEPYFVDVVTATNSGILKDINTSGASIAATDYEFVALGTNCFFAANDGTNGKEIWKTDGTTTGTSLYLDLNTGALDSNPDNLTVLGTQLAFAATHPTFGRELFKTNGTGSLTLLNDINSTGDSNPTNVTAIGGILYFGANNGTAGNELWKSNGNSIGTVLLKDINAAGDSNPSNFTLVGTNVYFTADDGVNGVELWKTDGTSTGTVLVKVIANTTQTISNLTAYNGKLYFVLRSPTLADTVWSSDGTSLGTALLLGNNTVGIIVFNNELYLSYNSTAGGQELYAYMDPALSTNKFQLSDKAITLFPNPSKSYFELLGEVTIEKVQVYSMLGQVVKTFNKQNQYAITDIAKGNYIVKINTTDGEYSKTLIIE